MKTLQKRYSWCFSWHRDRISDSFDSIHSIITLITSRTLNEWMNQSINHVCKMSSLILSFGQFAFWLLFRAWWLWVGVNRFEFVNYPSLLILVYAMSAMCYYTSQVRIYMIESIDLAREADRSRLQNRNIAPGCFFLSTEFLWVMWN
jgi:hypothetical protein